MRFNNKKGQATLYLIAGAAIFGMLFGGMGITKLGKLNPFKAKAGIVQKDEGRTSEFFRDKIKGIEYRSETQHKSQNTQNAAVSNTIGSKIGRFIDSSIQLIMFVLIAGTILLFLTGINIFKGFRRLGKAAQEAAVEANRYRKGLKQTVKAIKESKEKLNGEYEILAGSLRDTHDDETEAIVKQMKNE
jgi:hypothetical protein